MRRWLHRSLLVSVCATACAAVAVASLWLPAAHVRSSDQNGDGRPDVWRTYDRQGQLSDVAIDTNFDGRADVNEHYEHGALVRRDSDRDFNDRVDLVQEFDPTTHEHVRTVVDVDSDGTADLLVLFQDGRPVFSKWAQQPSPASVGTNSAFYSSAAPPAHGALAPLEDPFRGDLALRALRVLAAAGDYVGLSTSGGLPAPCTAIASPLALSSGFSDCRFSNPSSAAVVQYSPRGPPAPHLPS